MIQVASSRFGYLSQTIHLHLYIFYLPKWQLENNFNIYIGITLVFEYI